jgi:hypothetical protein
MCVFEIVWELMGRYAVMHEKNWLLYAFIVLGFVSPVWIIGVLLNFKDAFEGTSSITYALLEWLA